MDTDLLLKHSNIMQIDEKTYEGFITVEVIMKKS
jgi:hypothetical protein